MYFDQLTPDRLAHRVINYSAALWFPLTTGMHASSKHKGVEKVDDEVEPLPSYYYHTIDNKHNSWVNN